MDIFENEVLKLLNQIVEVQSKMNVKLESLTNRIDNSNSIFKNHEILQRHSQEINFLLHKVSVLEEEIFILKSSKAVEKKTKI